MFVRSLLRTSQPFKHGIRSYATQSSSSGGGGGLGVGGYSAIGITLASAGAWYAAAAQKKNAAPGTNPAPEQASAPQDAAPPKKAFVGGDQGFISLKLQETEEINHNTRKFIFSLPEEDQVSGLNVASALISQFKNDDMEKPVVRPYTPTSDEDAKGILELIIKQYPDGPMSNHIHSMKPGDTLDMKGPITKYDITENRHNHIAMIAGGTGITPMYQVMRQIFKNSNDKTKVSLVFGNISEDDILLKDKFDELENTYPQRFKAFYTLDKPKSENWTGGSGFITKDLLQTVLPEPKEDNIKIFVCGPPGLYKAISGAKKSPQDQGELDGALKELGYSKDQVFKF